MFKRYSKGFTLVELIVVIGMLGLFFTIAIPKIDKNPYYHISFSKTLRDDIRNIQYISMSEGINERILFDNYSYRIMEGSKIKEKVYLKEGYKIIQNFTDGWIAFKYNGAPINGGGSIKIMNEKTKRFCEITIVPATGRILMKDKIYKGGL